ncbi:MAG: glycosyltransferase family 4 protein [Patescibacteria group bacterium]
MKITISVAGRFHLFNLAQQLLKKNYLGQLITSYPKFEVVKYGIPREKINSVIIKEIIERGWRKLPGFLRNIYNPQYFIHEMFDFIASFYLKKGADIVIVSGLRTLKKAKKLGAITIGERGSSHILYQDKILREEYEKYGIKIRPFMLPHQKIIKNELKTYEELDYISIPSSFVRRTFLEYGIPENKLIQVPYGVDLSQFRQIPKNDDVFRVIFAGGMSLRKGVHYLLQAFSEIDLPNSELVLIGSLNEEIKPFFKKYSVSSVERFGAREGKIKYLGHIPQKELYKYYSQGSVFAIMSIEEGLAMVQPQVMACGLPVICTTNTGGEDIVRDGIDGFVIPIRDIGALKEKLIYFYKNPEICRRMGQSAKERVRNNFTWDKYGEKMIEEYKRILKI